MSADFAQAACREGRGVRNICYKLDYNGIIKRVDDGEECIMGGLFIHPGFLGTKAPFYADLSLVLLVFAALLLTIGWRLAVYKKYALHRWVQTGAVVLNAAVVLGVMVGSFAANILPGLPGHLTNAAYGLPTLHAAIGLMGLLLGLFVVLRANGLVPSPLRFSNYKLFMRTSYALYMLSTVLGMAVYLFTYR